MPKYRLTFERVRREVHCVTEEAEIVVEAEDASSAQDWAEENLYTEESVSHGLCWEETDSRIVAGETVGEPTVTKREELGSGVLTDYVVPVEEKEDA